MLAHPGFTLSWEAIQYLLGFLNVQNVLVIPYAKNPRNAKLSSLIELEQYLIKLLLKLFVYKISDLSILLCGDSKKQLRQEHIIHMSAKVTFCYNAYPMSRGNHFRENFAQTWKFAFCHLQFWFPLLLHSHCYLCLDQHTYSLLSAQHHLRHRKILFNLSKHHSIKKCVYIRDTMKVRVMAQDADDEKSWWATPKNWIQTVL